MRVLLISLMLLSLTACWGSEEAPPEPTPPAPSASTDGPTPTTSAQAADSSLNTPPTAAQSEAEPSKLRPEIRGVNWGYVDLAGDWVIDPQFDSASPFADGLALVNTEGQYGYITPDGQFAIPPQFTVGQDFSEGLAPVLTEQEQWGYIDKSGQLAIPAQFSFADLFSEGLAAVVVDEKYGFINQSGQLVIPPQFDLARGFVNGFAIVSQDGFHGFIDPTGQIMIAPQYEQADNFSEGLAVVVQNGQSGFVDPTGQQAIPPQFEWAGSFSEGLAVAVQEGKSGYIDQTGQFVIPPQFDTAWRFNEGLAPVNVEGRWGYIDSTGQTVIPPQFEWGDGFVDGLAFVQLDSNQAAFIDPSGQVVINIKPVEPVILGDRFDLTPEQVSFNYEFLANSVQAELTPATPISPGPGAGGAMPTHLWFTFEDDQRSEWFWPRDRQLRIYPTAGYQEIFDELDNGFLGRRLNDLEQILADQPSTIAGEIPFLPPIPAAQIFRSHVQYVNFQSGSGIRFISMYSQAPEPIHNELIFYTFQGLTADGQYYISLTYPVTALVLPDTFKEAQPEDRQAFMERFDSYMEETIQSINNLGQDDFSPSLVALDAMIQSLTITP